MTWLMFLGKITYAHQGSIVDQKYSKILWDIITIQNIDFKCNIFQNIYNCDGI